MALSRLHTWVSGEVLTASDLNAEFNNIINNLSVALTGVVIDGTAAASGLQFVNDSDTGIFRPGANRFAIAAGGVQVFEGSAYANGVNFVLVAPGQAGQPALLTATGSDTNVSLTLRGKGTGYVRASNFVFEDFSATQSPTITGRAYWQSTEGALHISAGTLMARVPALTDIRSGDLLAGVTVGGATRFGTIQAATNGLVLQTVSGQPTWSQYPPADLSTLVFATSTKLNLASGYIPLKVGGVWIRRDLHTHVELLSPAVNSNTLYYIYASDSAGSTVLEASTTGHAAAVGQNGIRVKSDDSTRTLVGMAFARTAGAFVASASNYLVASWFNRKVRVATSSFSTNRTTTSTSPVELGTEIRCAVALWADEPVSVGVTFTVNNPVADGATTRLAFDGTSPENDLGSNQAAAASLTIGGAIAYHKLGLTEGTHYVTLLGQVGSGTGTWLSDGVNGRYTAIALRAG